MAASKFIITKTWSNQPNVPPNYEVKLLDKDGELMFSRPRSSRKDAKNFIVRLKRSIHQFTKTEDRTGESD